MYTYSLQDVLLRPSGLLEGMTDDVCCVVAPVCRVPCEKARAVDLSAARENVTCGYGRSLRCRCAASVVCAFALRLAGSRLYGDGKSNENLFPMLHVWCT